MKFWEWLKDLFKKLTSQPIPEQIKADNMPTKLKVVSKYPEYEAQFFKAKLKAKNLARIQRECEKLLANKERYKAVEKLTDVPWYVIGAIHLREANYDFKTYLGNGDPLDKKSVHVPAGRGPFASWELGAIDAFSLVDKPKDWSLGGCLWFCENYNGFGNRKRGINSPYLWAMTDQYQKGGFPRDHVFDPEFVDEGNPGVAAIFLKLGIFKEEKAEPQPEVKKDQSYMAQAEKLKGKKETDPVFDKEMSKNWALVGLSSYKTIQGSTYAWCGLFVAAMLAAAGYSYQKNGASAAAWAKYGQAIDWKVNGIPRGAILHINHAFNCSSPSSNHVAFANGDCTPEELNKPGAKIDLLGGNQNNQVKVSTYSVKEICEVRWPKEKLLPGKITKSVNCANGASGNESTR